SCDYTDDVRISPQILKSSADSYRKIRNTLRFLLGNLYDFAPDKKVKYNKLLEIDRWALSSLAGLLTEVTEDFEQFRYDKAFRRIYNFCIHQMSHFYLDVLKDRLYTFDKESSGRRSAQTAICEILSALTKVLAPILSFTTEEVWRHLSKILNVQDSSVVLLNAWPRIERRWINLTLDKKMQQLSKIRDGVLKAIENEREKNIIHSSLEAKVNLFVQDDKLYRLLQENLELLVTIFIVSDVSLEKITSFSESMLRPPDVSGLAVKVEKIDFPKCQRCWNYRVSVGKNSKHPQICQRCVEVIEGREKDE
ncbi:MAG: class I tRNA ligase family protein, partial [Omnitrophica bacterium]|nr:class I tRNA ligase family protein [Candidatus Omnitrophota bacterium]